MDLLFTQLQVKGTVPFSDDKSTPKSVKITG